MEAVDHVQVDKILELGKALQLVLDSRNVLVVELDPFVNLAIVTTDSDVWW